MMFLGCKSVIFTPASLRGAVGVTGSLTGHEHSEGMLKLLLEIGPSGRAIN
jgi:hypothetical protein